MSHDGHLLRAAATPPPPGVTATAASLVRADLTGALASAEHTVITPTVSVEGVGVDRYLDRDSD